jgi:hypothetical protein
VRETSPSATPQITIIFFTMVKGFNNLGHELALLLDKNFEFLSLRERNLSFSHTTNNDYFVYYGLKVSII